MINVGCLATSLCHFVFVQQEHYMHQSHRRCSRRLMNADTLDGEPIGVLEYRIHCIICCWQRGCLSDQPCCFLYFSFIHICCHFSFYSFDVFGCAPHLLSKLYITIMCLWPEEQAQLFPHTELNIDEKSTFLTDKRVVSLHHCKNHILLSYKPFCPMLVSDETNSGMHLVNWGQRLLRHLFEIVLLLCTRESPK